MTRVNINDLPPKLRAQVLASDSGPTPPAGEEARKGRPGPVRGRSGPGPAYRCHTCAAEFPRWGVAAERHADSHHGARMEAILTTTQNPG